MTPEERARRSVQWLVDRGWADDEIFDYLRRTLPGGLGLRDKRLAQAALKAARAEKARAPLDETDPQSLRRSLTRAATEARKAAKRKRVERARQLRQEGLSVAQIATKMSNERGDNLQRPPIDPRTVRNWLREKQT